MIDITIHANVYTIDEPTRVRVAALEAEIQRLKQQEIQQMAFNQDFDARMSAMDAATNELASDLQGLRDQLAAAQGMDEAEKKAILDTLDAKITRLQVLGQAPANPVPSQP